MKKEDIKTLIRSIKEIDNIDNQQFILARFKDDMSEYNFSMVKNIIAMYNAEKTFNFKYTWQQYKYAMDHLKSETV